LSGKKIILALLGIVAAAGLVVVGIYSFKGIARYVEMHTDLLPTFTEPEEGPRAPTTAALGARVGFSTLKQVQEMFAAWGTACENTSMRALMQQMREEKKKEIAEAQARGEDIDGITGASMVNYRSKKERNPQVRLRCQGGSSVLKDRPRLPSDGRALYVFDSDDHPLRHASYRRHHKNHPAALDDVAETVAAMTRVFGAPHESTPLPQEEQGRVRFEPWKRYIFAWKWADLRVEISALNMRRTVDVNELIEVPWPVRADAPSR